MLIKAILDVCRDFAKKNTWAPAIEGEAAVPQEETYLLGARGLVGSIGLAKQFRGSERSYGSAYHATVWMLIATSLVLR